MQLVKEERIDGNILATFLANPEELSVHPEEFLSRDVDVLGLSCRTQNCLKVAGVRTIKELVVCESDDLLCVKGFKLSTLGEIKRCLRKLGLSLGMTNVS